MNTSHKVIAISVVMLSIPVGLYFQGLFNDEKNNDKKLPIANLAERQDPEPLTAPLTRQRRSADTAFRSHRSSSHATTTGTEPQDESWLRNQQPEPRDPWRDLTTPAKLLSEQFELIDTGDNLNLPLPDKPYFTLPVSKISYTPAGAKVISGGQQTHGGGSSFIITAGKDSSFGSVVTPDGSYSVSIINGETSILKKDRDSAIIMDCHQSFKNL
ncbi:hypothetical protein [Endozoicomonas sp.]|uniref:hypothetical protein n=1 Tax=Endozoicomonas sp. TaxID=1892382 RepID=UPI00383A9AC4